MDRIVGNRAERAERTKTSQAAHDWLTAEELGKHLNMSGDGVRELLMELGYGCRESKKPTKDAFHKKLARRYRHGGKTRYKWSRKEILPVLLDATRVAA